MLQGLRKASKSPVASIIIGMLVLAFALWGIQDVFRGGADTLVADVGKEQVTDYQFDIQLKNQLRQLSSQTQSDITMDQLKAMGQDKVILDQIVSRAALDDAGRRLGLIASQQAVIDQTKKTDVFKAPDGSFDQNIFLRALQESGLTEQTYIQATSKDIARGQLVNATVGGIVPPPGLARLLFDFVTEQRTMEYVVVTPDEAGAVPPAKDADLEAYHTAHAQQFSAPEYRAFDYVTITPDLVAKDVKVTDQELMAEYDAHRANYEKPEQREIEQIVFPMKDDADKAAARIKTAADFVTVANERGLKPADLKLGTFTKPAMDARLADAAFALPKGGVTMPVQGPFGWVILHAANVIPGENKSFDDVKEQIREDLVKVRSADLIRDLGDKLEDARGSGASLTDSATKLGIPVRHVAAADRTGATPEGGRAELPTEPSFVMQVFQTESGDESDLFTSEAGVAYAVHVVSITPPAVKPLSSVKEDVRTAYMTDVRQKQLQMKVDAFAEQVRKEGNFTNVGKALKHNAVTSMPLRRDQANDVYSRELLTQLFASPQGAVITGAAGQGNGMVIARVTKVAHSEPDVSAAEFVEYRKTASEQLVDTAIDSLAQAARAEAGVNIHQQTVQRVLGETPQ